MSEKIAAVGEFDYPTEVKEEIAMQRSLAERLKAMSTNAVNENDFTSARYAKEIYDETRLKIDLLESMHQRRLRIRNIEMPNVRLLMKGSGEVRALEAIGDSEQLVAGQSGVPVDLIPRPSVDPCSA